jgi:predicted nucleotidyltransferase
MKTALELDRQAWRTYRPCREIDEAQTSARWEHARRVANQAATLLRTRFRAGRVVAFGSVTRRDWFTPWSDVDLAVWGISPSLFFRAAAAVAALDPAIGVHVVDAEDCPQHLRRAIALEGVDCE